MSNTSNLIVNGVGTGAGAVATALLAKSGKKGGAVLMGALTLLNGFNAVKNAIKAKQEAKQEAKQKIDYSNVTPEELQEQLQEQLVRIQAQMEQINTNNKKLVESLKEIEEELQTNDSIQ